jgi:hypothetical protein
MFFVLIIRRSNKMEKFSINGRPFTVNSLGQKVDEDGFFTSMTTKRKGIWGFFCVSVKISDDKVQVRDTKDPSKTTLTFNRGEWLAFLKGVRAGEFDLKS